MRTAPIVPPSTHHSAGRELRERERERAAMFFPSLFSSPSSPACDFCAERMWEICKSKLLLVLLCLSLLAVVSPAKIHGNPANDLVALINTNRTASKLPALRNSAGLGCMALQYIFECMASNGAAACGSDNTVACAPPEADITEVYAANCGVELPTVDVISGRLIGCDRERSGPPELALQAVLASGNKTKAAAAAAVLRGKEHTQVGAGFDRSHRHGPFFWCLLFSSGSANSTFLLEAAGKGIKQTRGCFSAPDRLSCSAAAAPPSPSWLAGAVPVLLSLSLSRL